MDTIAVVVVPPAVLLSDKWESALLLNSIWGAEAVGEKLPHPCGPNGEFPLVDHLYVHSVGFENCCCGCE